MNRLSRRDFLNLGMKLFELSLASRLMLKVPKKKKTSNLPNIVVLVCDAMSAKNLSLYGYARKTTPNLEKLANQAYVYHNHRSNANFTSPGTSSILTGLNPWTHRAINMSGKVASKFSQHNLFHFLENDYFKLAYGQNLWASYLLDQFSSDIDVLLPLSEFGLTNGASLNQKFKNDFLIANHALERMLFYANSLLLSFIYGLYYQTQTSLVPPSENYPHGFPVVYFYDLAYTMENLFNGIANQIIELDKQESPFFSYFHIYPPHDPYVPHVDFAGMFDNDNYQAIVKSEHVLSRGVKQQSHDYARKNYDAFIANVDMEIGRLVEKLKAQGILEHTYFIITSDHGEMFERGTNGHVTPLLYEPIIRIPLMILVPGNQTRQDILAPTASIDLLPTILNIAGKKIPVSCEGELLPKLGGAVSSNRSIISMDAKESSANRPFTRATYTIIKKNHKLIYYKDYNHHYKRGFEFYDILEDPEELQDEYSNPRFTSIISNLKEELFSAMKKANENLSS